MFFSDESWLSSQGDLVPILLTRRGEFSEQPVLEYRKSRTYSRTLYTWRQNWCFVCNECMKCNWIELNDISVRALLGPMHLGLKTGPLFPTFYAKLEEPCSLAKFQMAPMLSFLISSESKKKGPRYVCLSEAKASHSHKMWTEVFSPVPYFLHVGLLLSPVIYKCLLKVLWPVSRPITTLDCVLVKDNTYLLTHSMQKSPWQANQFSAIQ